MHDKNGPKECQEYLDVLIATGALPEDPTVLTFSQLDLDLTGFKRTNSEDHWTKLFRWVQHEFDPEKLLIRRINAEPPPKGRAEKAWVQCVKALVNLQRQHLYLQPDGSLAPDEMFDQLTMLARCLPILLLRVPPMVQRDAKAGFIVKNCHRFLTGAWRSLSHT